VQSAWHISSTGLKVTVDTQQATHDQMAHEIIPCSTETAINFMMISMKYTRRKINDIFLLNSALEQNICAVQHCHWNPEPCKYIFTISTEIQDKQERMLSFAQMMKNLFYFYKCHCSLNHRQWKTRTEIEHPTNHVPWVRETHVHLTKMSLQDFLLLLLLLLTRIGTWNSCPVMCCVSSRARG
jgi:chromosome condensin MukBEF complex kleisin-like MukF subunit